MRWMIQRSMAFLLYTAHAILYLTCRREFVGLTHLTGLKSMIFCGWHIEVVPFITAFWRFDQKMSYLAIDSWKMWPIHWLLRQMGVGPLISVNEPRAIERMSGYLASGYSTVITPDGPRGPAKVLRNGVLNVAQVSGAPIIPVRVDVSRAWIWSWSWDQKRIPIPFAKITVRYGEPIYVTSDILHEARERLLSALG